MNIDHEAIATMTAEEALAALLALDLSPERRATIEDLEKRYRALVEKDAADHAHREALEELLKDFESFRASVVSKASAPRPRKNAMNAMTLPLMTLAAMGPHIEERPRFGYSIRTAEERRAQRAAKEEVRAARRARKAAKKGKR